jgi:hypothetical protein
MKRIHFGGVLLILLLVLGFLSSSFMERTLFSQAEHINRAAELAMEGNWAAAQQRTGTARREWDKNRMLIAALTDHTPMDQVEGLFAQLEAYGRQQDALSYSSTCLYLARQLEALGKSHSLSLENFL